MLVTLLLLMLEVPGRSRHMMPRETLKFVEVGGKVNVGVDVGEGMENKRMAKKKRDKPSTATPVTETSTALKGATRSVTVVVRSATQWWDTLDRCAVFVTKRTIQPKAAPTSSLSLCVKLTQITATVTKF